MPTVRPSCLAALVVVVCGLFVAVSTAPGAAAAGPTFTFNGGGFGHGLGMSQYGALGHAKAGDGATTILGAYYSATSVAWRSQPNPQVHLGNAPSTTVTVSGTVAGDATDSGQVEIDIVNQCCGPSMALKLAPGQAITITDNGTDTGGRYHLVTSGYDASFGSATSFVLVKLALQPTTLGLTGNRFKWGDLVLADDGGGSLDAIALDMTMQQYLYGLGEVPSSWPLTALQAQAAAGRTYAKNKIERQSPCPTPPTACWNLEGSTVDQVFVGYDKVAGSYGAQWKSAVDGTEGATILDSNGAAIQAFYSSSSGGYTENSEYVFSAKLDYIRGVPDGADSVSDNPNYRWTRSFDGDQLATKLALGTARVTNLVISADANHPEGVSGRINRELVTVTDVNGVTKTLSGGSMASRLGLLSTLVLSVSNSANTLPIGNYDAVTAGATGVAVSGWAGDFDVPSQALEIDVWADGAFAGYGYASLYRSDVGAAYPALGPNHGFSFGVALPPGTHNVCVFAIDGNQPSKNTGLGCRSATVVDHPPFGNFETTVRIPGGLSAQGWAIDPDTTGPIEIDAYVDGAFAGYGSADRSRPDVGQAYPGYGPNHGFDFNVAVPAGTHNLCLYMIDYGGSVNPTMGCTTVSISGQPFGNLDYLARSGSSAYVQGWAIDPDTAVGIEIDVLVNGVLGGYGAADRPRPDVGQTFPRYGPNHGFDLIVPIGASPATVCVYAINTGAGTNTNLGCRTI